jgi:DNA-binding XRE family transcriptional regulator
MTPRAASDLLARTLNTQKTAADQLSRCQEHGPDLFKSVRTHLEWDQPRMAKALGVHPTYLSKVENKKTPPGLHLLEALQRIIETDAKAKG